MAEDLNYVFPENLILLKNGEEFLHSKSLEYINKDENLILHLNIIESAMEIADIFRQSPSKDEDIKVIQMLGMRCFNALASSLNLLMIGYYQNSALIVRDIIETIFLLDLFRTDPQTIKQWRMANKKERRDNFRPVKVREKLDKRDGFTERRRAEIYELFSELAGHPTMQSFAMLRPNGMDARNGPFVDTATLEATLSEMGRLAIQVGEILEAFFPKDWEPGKASIRHYQIMQAHWLSRFYMSSKAEKLKGVNTKTA